MKRTFLLLFSLCLLGSVTLFSGALPVFAANQVVSDCGDNGGANQLRAKLNAAQSSGGGTITFSCTGPIALAYSLPDIASSITIDGANKITLSGNNADIIFYVDGGATLTLKNITLTKGVGYGDGGAIINEGTLNISGSKFLDNHTAETNSGGAIASSGKLTVTNSEFGQNSAGSAGAIFLKWGAATATISGANFHDNEVTGPSDWGGAILVFDGASATISASTFKTNSAIYGGAIYVYSGGAKSTLTLNTTTLDHNSAYSGGAIYNANGTVNVNTSTFNQNDSYRSKGSEGGAIYNDGGTLTLTNATLFGNRGYSSGAIGNGNSGETILVNVTAAGNSATTGAGTFGNSGGGINVKNTLVAKGTTGANCEHVSGTYSYSDDDSCLFAAGHFDVALNLGTLSNNGGSTQTILPLADSPAIDNGTGSGCPSTDQRGFHRPQGLACDVGAIEIQPATPTPTRTKTPIHTPTRTNTPVHTPTRTPTRTATPAPSCNAKPAAPTLVSPVNGATAPKASVTLSWKRVNSATKYKLVVKRDTKNGVKVGGANTTNLSYTTPALTKQHTYYWFVKACNGSFGCKKSAVWTFKLK